MQITGFKKIGIYCLLHKRSPKIDYLELVRGPPQTLGSIILLVHVRTYLHPHGHSTVHNAARTLTTLLTRGRGNGKEASLGYKMRPVERKTGGGEGKKRERGQDRKGDREEEQERKGDKGGKRDPAHTASLL